FNEAVARARDKFRMRMSLAVPGLVAVWAEAEVGRQIDDGHSCVAGPLDDGRGGAVGRGAEQHVTCAYHFVLVCETQVGQQAGELRPACIDGLAKVLPRADGCDPDAAVARQTFDEPRAAVAAGSQDAHP